MARSWGVPSDSVSVIRAEPWGWLSGGEGGSARRASSAWSSRPTWRAPDARRNLACLLSLRLVAPQASARNRQQTNRGEQGHARLGHVARGGRVGGGRRSICRGRRWLGSPQAEAGQSTAPAIEVLIRERSLRCTWRDEPREGVRVAVALSTHVSSRLARTEEGSPSGAITSCRSGQCLPLVLTCRYRAVPAQAASDCESARRRANVVWP